MPRPHLLLPAALALLGACASPPSTRARDAMPLSAGPGMVQLAEVKDNLDTIDQRTATAPTAAPPSALPSTVQPLIGRGFGQIAGQPGKTYNERRLMAIRAARLEAMRDLTEQIHGIRLAAQTTMQDATVTDDRLNATIQGTLRGARTRKITPRGDDGYEVELEIDRDTLGYIVRALR